MDQRELTQQEADKLFQQTFLRLHRENLAEKQKNKGNIVRSISHSVDHTIDSPKKSPISSFSIPKMSNFQLSPIKLQKNPENLNLKTRHKFSTDKQQSINQIQLIEEGEQSLMVSQVEYKLKRCNRLFSYESQNDIKNSNEMQIQSPPKKIQFLQKIEEKLYIQSQIKEVKRDLQIKFRGKLCRTGLINGYKFSCKNDSNCPFDCVFQYTGLRNLTNQKLYKLILKNSNHIKNCIQQEEEVVYMKLTKTVDSMEQAIIGLLNTQNNLKPKEILSYMAQKMGQSSHKFIYKGLVSKQYHKAAKKYFDNLIYKIKNQIGIL